MSDSKSERANITQKIFQQIVYDIHCIIISDSVSSIQLTLKFKEKILTVRKALNKGHLWMTLPTMGFMFIFPVVCYFTIVQLATAIPNIAIIGISILVGWTLGWLSWSYFVVKWKIYAFSNVDKTLWTKLYRSAVKENLIWEIGSVFEKTEIRNTQQNYIINQINSSSSHYRSS